MLCCDCPEPTTKAAPKPNDAQPFGPNGVDEDIDSLRLNQPGSMPDPCDPEGMIVGRREIRAEGLAAALGEYLW